MWLSPTWERPKRAFRRHEGVHSATKSRCRADDGRRPPFPLLSEASRSLSGDNPGAAGLSSILNGTVATLT